MRGFLFLTLLFISSLTAANAEDVETLLGTYENTNHTDFRTTTVSKISVELYKGEPRVHAWYYGQPNDIDWGTSSLRKYSAPGYPNQLKWVAQLHHENDDSILIINPQSEIALSVDSYTLRANNDARHPSLFTNDMLKRVEEKSSTPSLNKEEVSQTGNISISYNGTKGDFDSTPYLADLRRRIKRGWFPPRGQESKRVKVIFKITSDGKLEALRIAGSSGRALADKAALDAVQNAAPFRPLPAGATQSADVTFTFDYNLFSGNR